MMALDHAIASVVESGGPLVPFAIIDQGGERSLSRFTGEMGEAQEHARAEVREAGNLDMAAVAWDGYITLDGQRTDAVFVEAYSAGDESSFVLAQQYQIAGRLRKTVEPLGDPALVQHGQPLF